MSTGNAFKTNLLPSWLPTHRHRKGNLYRVIARGYYETDLAAAVVYDDAAGKVWVRPAAEFDDGRFTPIEEPAIAPVSGTADFVSGYRAGLQAAADMADGQATSGEDWSWQHRSLGLRKTASSIRYACIRLRALAHALRLAASESVPSSPPDAP